MTPAAEAGVTAPVWAWLPRLLRAVLAAAAGLSLVTWIAVVALRAGHPFELEWLEGATLDHVDRILAGKPLYGPPDLEFIPFSYTPVYYYVAAAAASITGPGFLPLRLVSILAAAGVIVLIFVLVRRETGDPRAAGLAACLFTATYRISGAWHDVARVDSLCVFLLLLAVCLARDAGRRGGLILAGAAAALAVLTKQTVLPGVALLCAYSVWEAGRRAVWLWGTAAVVLAGSVWALDRIHDGWFAYYAMGLPLGCPFVARGLVLFWLRDLLAPLPIACLAGFGYLMTLAVDRDRERLRFYLCLAAGLVGTSLAGRTVIGAYDNVRLPACVALSILFGLGAHRLASEARLLAGPRGAAARSVLQFAAIVQFAALVYDPLAQLPGRADREAGRRLVQRLSGLPGPVFMPGHPYLLRRAGKPGHAHYSALLPLLTCGRGPARDSVERQLRDALDGQRFAAVVLDSDRWLSGALEGRYRAAETVLEGDVFWPVTGARLRPDRLYVPVTGGPGSAPP